MWIFRILYKKKLKIRTKLKKSYQRKKPNNINKNQENKPVNFFSDNKKLLSQRASLKINYHFRNKEKSRNSFNIISENNEQVGNVYNTYQKIIPNKIVNIMSFIQKIINKKLVKKESDKLSIHKISTDINLIN